MYNSSALSILEMVMCTTSELFIFCVYLVLFILFLFVRVLQANEHIPADLSGWADHHLLRVYRPEALAHSDLHATFIHS
jgi:hypothetical protein